VQKQEADELDLCGQPRMGAAQAWTDRYRTSVLKRRREEAPVPATWDLMLSGGSRGTRLGRCTNGTLLTACATRVLSGPLKRRSRWNRIPVVRRRQRLDVGIFFIEVEHVRPKRSILDPPQSFLLKWAAPGQKLKV